MPKSKKGSKRSDANGHATHSLAATHVRAIESFDPLMPGELGFKKGEVIKIVDRGYNDFWRGHLRGKFGFFPVEFVVRCSFQLSDPFDL